METTMLITTGLSPSKLLSLASLLTTATVPSEFDTISPLEIPWVNQDKAPCLVSSITTTMEKSFLPSKRMNTSPKMANTSNSQWIPPNLEELSKTDPTSSTSFLDPKEFTAQLESSI